MRLPTINAQSILRQTFLLAATFFCVVLPWRGASAEDGAVLRFPVMGKTRFPSGLKMEVDTRWVEAQGYRPIRVTLGTASGAPATGDVSVRVEIRAYSRSNPEESTDRMSAYVTLPQGKASTTTTLLMLQESLWTQLRVDTYSDSGRQLLDLSSISAASTSARRINQGYGWDQDAISFLVIHPNVSERSKRTTGTTGTSAAFALQGNAASASGNEPNKIPDLRSLALQIPDPVATYNMYTAGQTVSVASDPAITLTDSQLMDWLGTRSNFEMLPPKEVPTRWLELTGFDFLVLSKTEAESLAKTAPRRWETIRKWTHAGGNLIVYGTGKEIKGLTDLDILLEDPQPAWPWKLAPASKSTTNIDYVSESVNYWGGQEQKKIDIDKARPTQSYFTAQNRRCGLGFVIAIEETDVFPGTSRQWTALINSAPGWRALWSVRNGVSLSESNVDTFWHYAIPGFGMAPVMLFVALISIFVIVMGPINYGWLKKRKQLSLMIFTVPLGAIITILSLSAYAMLGDGVSTRIRTWSLTELDQRTGRCTSLSHQTYYSGIPPWSGLQFPPDAAVYPVDQLPELMGYSNGYTMRRSPRDLEWDEKQNLRRGYISSRTLSQFVVLHPTTSTAKLIVQKGRATNQLNVKIKKLIVRGDDDLVLHCNDIANGASKDLLPLEKADLETIKETIAAAMPQEMEAFDSAAYTSAMSNNNRARFGGNWRTYTSTAEGEGLLLEGLKECEAPSAATGALPPRSYIAIVEKSLETPIGVASAVETQCFHVIRGRW